MTTASLNPAFIVLESSASTASLCLAAADLDDEQVHMARKALKKARAALRLLRPALDDAEYRAHNRALRDAGRCLSPLRDAHALLKLLADCQADDPPSRRVIAALRAALEGEVRERRADLVDAANRAHCTALVEHCRAQLSRADVAQAAPRSLHRALRNIYRRAGKTFVRARRAPDTESLHEWRKQTKYLRSACEILRDAGLQGLGKPIARGNRIVGLLGDEHDLSVLSDMLVTRALTREAAALSARIEKRRAVLRKRALACGAKLFAQKLREFGPVPRKYDAQLGA